MITHQSIKSKLSIDYQHTCDSNFKYFLFCIKFNRALLLSSFFLAVLSIIIFKYFYPFASFINGDSYSYITSAFYNLRADVYPIGYPKFLRLISVFNYNDSFLVLVQYSLIMCSIITLLFSLFYFFSPLKWVQVLMILLIVPNPIFLYIANYVSSDSLFISLSIFWITTLIWIILRPSFWPVALHTVVITMCFMVRYNALVYPIISCFSFFITKEKITIKIIGLTVCLVTIGAFINFTSKQFKRISGTNQFSPFSGWQLANNAMYAYRFVDSSERKELAPRFRNIDKDVRNYFDSTRDKNRHPQEMLYASTIYMWDNISPLRIYMNRTYPKDSMKSDLVSWAKVAPLYKEYGLELIKKYPLKFTKYYLFPNFLKYYVPPVEFLGSYSTGVDSVPPIAKQWFWYGSNKLKFRTKSMEVSILNWYPIISGVSNVLFVALSASYFFLYRINITNLFFRVWLLVAVFWVSNLVFSVFASPIALRFQTFPLLMTIIHDFFLFDTILKFDNISKIISSPEANDKSIESLKDPVL